MISPLILAAITGGVKLAEVLFGGKTGDAKKQFVTASVAQVTDQFLTAGKIKEKVDPNLISLAIDTSVAVMNQFNLFRSTNPDGTPIVPRVSPETAAALASIFASLANTFSPQAQPTS